MSFLQNANIIRKEGNVTLMGNCKSSIQLENSTRWATILGYSDCPENYNKGLLMRLKTKEMNSLPCVMVPGFLISNKSPSLIPALSDLLTLLYIF